MNFKVTSKSIQSPEEMRYMIGYISIDNKYKMINIRCMETLSKKKDEVLFSSLRRVIVHVNNQNTAYIFPPKR